MSKKDIAQTTKDFYITQIKTTIKIVNNFSNSEEFSPAMLLNSLLSLVVLPYEDAKKHDGKKIFPGEFNKLIKSLDCNPEIFMPIKKCTDGEVDYGNRTIYTFVNKFRNGIAHQNLKVVVDEDRKIHITIFNVYLCKDCKKCKNKKCEQKGLKPQGQGVVDFQITVTVQQLQKIALYIANRYLKSIE